RQDTPKKKARDRQIPGTSTCPLTDLALMGAETAFEVQAEDVVDRTVQGVSPAGSRGVIRALFDRRKVPFLAEPTLA
ncbi:hypothetical protein, partial [Kitasatospora sp. NPDC051914]|uniref:hypothetical protein n=1 Tax=Kitasatospora sp. NPDC051914 TaxID=3154945 RepID=UPI003446E021